MAATLNKVFLMGNLTRDPDIRRIPSGETVAELSLAVSEQFRSKTTNEVREIVTYVDVTVWGKVAENCSTYLARGRPIFVEGRLTLDTWEDKATGQKRSRLRVRADRVQFLFSVSQAPRRDASAMPSSDWAPVSQASAPMPHPAAPTPPANETQDVEDLPF